MDVTPEPPSRLQTKPPDSVQPQPADSSPPAVATQNRQMDMDITPSTNGETQDEANFFLVNERERNQLPNLTQLNPQNGADSSPSPFQSDQEHGRRKIPRLTPQDTPSPLPTYCFNFSTPNPTTENDDWLKWVAETTTALSSSINTFTTNPNSPPLSPNSRLH